MRFRKLAQIVILTLATAASGLNCGGGGGGGSSGGSGGGGNGGGGNGGGGNGGGGETPTNITGELSPNPAKSEKAYAPLVLRITNAACPSGSPAFKWTRDNVTLEGETSSSYICGDKSNVARQIRAIIACSSGTKNLGPIYINAGSAYAADELKSLLEKPVAAGGFDSTITQTGYSVSAIDMKENSTPGFFFSEDKGFTYGFYESIAQKVIDGRINDNGTIKGCIKDAVGNYNEADCITIDDLIAYKTAHGFSELFLFPTEGKTFDQLNAAAVQALTTAGYLSRTAGKVGKKEYDVKAPKSIKK